MELERSQGERERRVWQLRSITQLDWVGNEIYTCSTRERSGMAGDVTRTRAFTIRANQHERFTTREMTTTTVTTNTTPTRGEGQ